MDTNTRQEEQSTTVKKAVGADMTWLISLYLTVYTP